MTIILLILLIVAIVSVLACVVAVGLVRMKSSSDRKRTDKSTMPPSASLLDGPSSPAQRVDSHGYLIPVPSKTSRTSQDISENIDERRRASKCEYRDGRIVTHKHAETQVKRSNSATDLSARNRGGDNVIYMKLGPSQHWKDVEDLTPHYGVASALKSTPPRAKTSNVSFVSTDDSVVEIDENEYVSMHDSWAEDKFQRQNRDANVVDMPDDDGTKRRADELIDVLKKTPLTGPFSSPVAMFKPFEDQERVTGLIGMLPNRR